MVEICKVKGRATAERFDAIRGVWRIKANLTNMASGNQIAEKKVQ